MMREAWGVAPVPVTELEAANCIRRSRVVSDPRDDLVEDSVLWQRLLSLAYDLDGDASSGLCGALHGLRCYGAALIVENGQARLCRGEMTEIEYAELRQDWLIPHHKALRTLLGSLSASER